MHRMLTAYFSRRGHNYCNGAIRYLEVGNTEIAARKIQDQMGGELFHIETVRPYAEDY